jgi:hypothetical protein
MTLTNTLHAGLLIILFLLAGCKDMGTEPQAATPSGNTGSAVSFQQRVLPIFTLSGCTGCHGGTNGLTVGTVASLLQGGIHGPAVIPGNADGSLIIKKTSPTPPFGERMPQGGPYLADTTIQVIRDWINQGAQDN